MEGSQPCNVALTPGGLQVAQLLCNNTDPCAKHREQAAEFFRIFASELPWFTDGDVEKTWQEIDGFAAARAANDEKAAQAHILNINRIMMGIASAAWSRGNQAGKRVASSISVVNLDKPISG